jgi:hypothetical protein
MSKDEKELDTIVTMLADRAHGLDQLLDAVFGFLRRRSDFFTAPKNVQEEQVLAALRKQAALYVPPSTPEKQKTIPKPPQAPLKVSKPADDGTPPPGNGGTTDRYTWSQELKEVTIHVPFTGRRSDIVCNITSTHLYVWIRNNDVPLIDDDFFDKVVVIDSFWVIDGNELHITLQKTLPYTWWKCVIKGDPEIDTTKVTTEPTSNVDDLDSETQVTVKKMLFNQRQKALGLPDSDEITKQEIMSSFYEQHPEMANIN